MSCNRRWVTIWKTPHGSDLTILLSEIFRHGLAALQFQADGMIVLDPEWWRHLITSSASIQADGNAYRFEDVSCQLQPSAFAARLAQDFAALITVRSPIPNTRPVSRLGGAPLARSPAGQDSVDRSRAMSTGFEMLYGASRPAQTTRADADNPLMADALRRLRNDSIHDRPAPTPRPADVPIAIGSRWVQRQSGMIMDIVAVTKAIDGNEVVTMKRSGSDDAATRLLKDDFLEHHRPYGDAGEKTNVSGTQFEISIGEEWEEVAGGGMITVTNIDVRREMVHGDEPGSKRGRQIPFAQFTSGRWRRLIRRSAYDRLRKPDLGE
jgi:hypothetical protein